MTALHSAAVQCGTNFPLLGNYVRSKCEIEVLNRVECCLVCKLGEREARLRLYPGLDAVSAQHATHPQVAAHAAQEPDDVHPLVPAPHRDRGGYIPLDW